LQDKKGSGAPSLTREERVELNNLKEDFKKLKIKKAALMRKST